jgi:hypothetical protein
MISSFPNTLFVIPRLVRATHRAAASMMTGRAALCGADMGTADKPRDDGLEGIR